MKIRLQSAAHADRASAGRTEPHTGSVVIRCPCSYQVTMWPAGKGPCTVPVGSMYRHTGSSDPCDDTRWLTSLDGLREDLSCAGAGPTPRAGSPADAGSVRVRAHTRMCTLRTCACTHMHAPTHKGTHTGTHCPAHRHKRACAPTPTPRTRTHKHTYACTRTHACAHTHTHARTHISPG